MKKLILSLTLLYGVIAFGQGFGVQAGLNLGKLTIIEEEIKYDVQMKPGILIGANYNYGLSDNLFVRAGLNFSQYGGKTSYYNEYGEWTVIETYTINYIEIPLLLKYYFSDSEQMRFFGVGGLTYALALSGKHQIEYKGEDVPNPEVKEIKFVSKYDENMDYFQLKNTNLGFRMGVGAAFNNYEIGLSYTAPLSDISVESGFSFKTSLISLTVGLQFQ